MATGFDKWHLTKSSVFVGFYVLLTTDHRPLTTAKNLLARYVLNEKAASLLKLNKTPPPALLRAQCAIALDHLPSVPSVVLPNL